MFLTEAEIVRLTKHRRHDAQVRELRHMGIEHRTRRDGSVAVLKSHVEKLLDGVVSNAITEEQEPKWDAL